MATKKAEPAAEVEPETEEPTADDGLTEKIRSVVEEMLARTPEKVEEVEDDKPLTSREEERRASSLVSEVINGFKEALAEAKGEPKEEKKEPEELPAKKSVRKVEKYLWGVE